MSVAVGSGSRAVVLALGCACLGVLGVEGGERAGCYERLYKGENVPCDGGDDDMHARVCACPCMSVHTDTYMRVCRCV